MHEHDAPIWVFHAGALGDFVLTWPLLRTWLRNGHGVALVAPGTHGTLARRVFAAEGLHRGLRVEDGEQRRWTALWTGDPPGPPERGTRVVTFVADESNEGGRRWFDAARAAFEGAPVEAIGPPGSASRLAAWRAADVARLGAPASDAPHAGADGPVVCHVGAGSPVKRWPMACWTELAERLACAGLRVRLIGGEVEREKLSAEERRRFDGAGGALIHGLEELETLTRRAGVFVGADSGPGHLAAQLGVPTVSLFGPTDPAVWAPVGPRVRVLAPPARGPMSWLGVRVAEAAVRNEAAGGRDGAGAGARARP